MRSHASLLSLPEEDYENNPVAYSVITFPEYLERYQTDAKAMDYHSQVQ